MWLSLPVGQVRTSLSPPESGYSLAFGPALVSVSIASAAIYLSGRI